MIRPHPSTEYRCTQSKHENVPELPTRMICVAPSGSGKTVLIISLLLEIYPRCFQRIFIFSPTVHVDRQWDAVKKFQAEKMKVDDSKEQLYFDAFTNDDLEAVMKQQEAVVKLAKERDLKKMFGIAIILDDVADDPSITRSSRALHTLFTRGRHSWISTILSTQKYRSLAPIIRYNCTDLIVFRLRSQMELDAILEEHSAVYGKKTLKAMYNIATNDPYGFLYIKMTAKKPLDMFWKGFEARLAVVETNADKRI